MNIAINRFTVALYISKLWAYIGLFITKIFEYVFKLILLIPNNQLSILSKVVDPPLTTQNKTINIIKACSESGNISNKLKLFFKYYYTTASKDSAFDTNGFSMVDFKRLLNCSYLYCSYILLDGDTKEISDCINVLLAKYSNDTTNLVINGNKKETIFNHVSFDDEEIKAKKIYDNSFYDLSD